MGGLMDGWGWAMTLSTMTRQDGIGKADHGLMEGRPKTADVTVDDD